MLAAEVSAVRAAGGPGGEAAHKGADGDRAGVRRRRRRARSAGCARRLDEAITGVMKVGFEDRLLLGPEPPDRAVAEPVRGPAADRAGVEAHLVHRPAVARDLRPHPRRRRLTSATSIRHVHQHDAVLLLDAGGEGHVVRRHGQAVTLPMPRSKACSSAPPVRSQTRTTPSLHEVSSRPLGRNSTPVQASGCFSSSSFLPSGSEPDVGAVAAGRRHQALVGADGQLLDHASCRRTPTTSPVPGVQRATDALGEDEVDAPVVLAERSATRT